MYQLLFVPGVANIFSRIIPVLVSPSAAGKSGYGGGYIDLRFRRVL